MIFRRKRMINKSIAIKEMCWDLIFAIYVQEENL